MSADQLVHIHRLQTAPGEGLYVATHTGLYLLDADGSIAAVGDATHDLMGFTVAGPGDLLASGHPDLRDESLQVEGKPPLLGLVASDDGEGWRSLSLLGEVDFHALVSAHGRIYGIDSQTGALMVSSDRKTWQTHGKGLPFSDVAVSPEDPDLLLGAGPSGVAVSTDGGETFEGGSPEQLVYLSWSEAGLYGVSPEGAVRRSTDGGATWSSAGLVNGAPHALLVDGERIYVANEGGIWLSQGGGQFEPFVEVQA